ncbi:hypothetical protein CAEBREN_03013 [Caenorhabditis brenneri]|uniref:Uncharacterized protein n=1 Tax=Caenorhabditis brenneri TaxID=135651 RepID=G0PC05_CAEBE|nr:hypothetical protein CAEBREN_03013 [Caenorhabditis brenneri]
MISIPNYIPIGISHYFFAGFSRQKCLENLLKSHWKNPKIFPKMGLLEVNFWYDSFESGNFDMTQNYPKVLSAPESVSLEEM